MESLQLVVNHSWFGFICKSRRRFYCTVSVTTRITLRRTGGSLKTLSTLPRPVMPTFNKISDKLISIFIMCHISVVPRDNGFSQETVFFRSNRHETIRNAWCYNISLQPDMVVWGSLKSASFWQKMNKTETHFSLLWHLRVP